MSRQLEQATGTSSASRKEYTPPTLRDYGNVRDLTATNAAGPNFDGGGGANIYAS
jgi:hypothetical protein